MLTPSSGSLAHLTSELSLGCPAFPTLVARPSPASTPPRAPRPGLVRLVRPLAEVHEDAAHLGWPPGAWCE